MGITLKPLFLFAIVLNAIFLWGCKNDRDTETPSGYELVWGDEFSTNGLPDDTKWSYDIGGSGWGNNEAQYYTGKRLKNSEVKDGYLYINAIKEDFEGKIYFGPVSHQNERRLALRAV